MPRLTMPRSGPSRLPKRPSRTLSRRPLRWKRLRASMSIPTSCLTRASFAPLRPRPAAAVLAGVASAMRSAAPSRSASVAPLLKRVRRMLRLLRPRLLPSRRSPRGSKSPWRPKSPSVVAVLTLRLHSRMPRVRLKSLLRLQTMLRSLPRRLRVRVVLVAVLRDVHIP